MKYIKALVLIFTLILVSCDSNSGNNPESKVDVTFGYQNVTQARSKAINKTPVAVIISINDNGGTPVHTSVRLNLQNQGGNFITEPLALLVGNYSITEYKVVNAGDTVIYATPLDGSTAAALVNDALEIDFSVTANGTSLIQPEVLDTEVFTPAEFGFTSGGFTIVSSFHFLVTISAYDVNSAGYILTDANVEVKSGTHTDFNEAVLAGTRAIEVRDFNDSTYSITVSKSGYLDWSNTYTNTEMKSFDGADSGETPLSVILQKDPNFGLVSTFAGSSQGYADGTGSAAKFFAPMGIDTDAAGNVYVVDLSNHRIRKITPAGVVTTIAGSSAGYADGNGAAAKFDTPTNLELDAAGNIYVMDYNNHRVRKITPAGDVTTLAGSGVAGFADGTGTAAQFNYARGITVDASGNVYVGDTGNFRIRKITPAGVVTTVAGNATQGSVDANGTSAQLIDVFELTVDASGNIIFTDQHKIRQLSPSGDVTTIAGNTQGFSNGNGTSAQFNTPTGIDVDANGVIYVMEQYGSRARKISTSGDVTTLAGTGVAGNVDGAGTIAQFAYARGIVVDLNGNVYIGDEGNHTIRKITN